MCGPTDETIRGRRGFKKSVYKTYGYSYRNEYVYFPYQGP